MKAIDIYQKETKDLKPTDQISYYEWNQRYERWLEQVVETMFNKQDVGNSVCKVKAINCRYIKFNCRFKNFYSSKQTEC